ncbi:MAG TPA: SRPBCC family protein [Allosphingosinicella sp.]|nr:SRPBCC family protein [Allosphingosinicella sp.]
MTTAPEAKAQMLIRRPAPDLFEAFADPEITGRFWFSEGSARLEPGATVTWTWAMYGFSTPVAVRELEPTRRILIDWGQPDEATQVEWRFEPRGEDSTFVAVRNWGFRGDLDAQIAQALDSTGGFNLVLAAAKAWLEHGIELNVVLDHDPDSLVQS